MSERSAARALAYGIHLAGRIPGVESALRWWARLYREGSVVRIRSGYARGMLWRRYRRYVNGYWLGQYELPLQSALVRELTAGGVFYDIGANAGFLSLVSLARVGSAGLCVAFDPDPENCRNMRDLAELNELRNWTVVNQAVAARCGEGRFVRACPSDSAARLQTAGAPPGGEELMVRITTVDAATENHRPPTLVKVDVEGAEGEVLLGATEVLREVRPSWLIELHGTAPARSVHEILRAADYELWNLDGHHVSVPDPDGHILARPAEARSHG